MPFRSKRGRSGKRVSYPITSRHVDRLRGGLADKKVPSQFDPVALQEGIKVELEHTSNLHIAKEIAMDHLTEDPKYYEKLRTMESQVMDDKLMGELNKSFENDLLFSRISGNRVVVTGLSAETYTLLQNVQRLKGRLFSKNLTFRPVQRVDEQIVVMDIIARR